tara:strand:- start:292 stop:417 length:126 start_codon:yes stop_codon:yes gene_type:complete
MREDEIIDNFTIIEKGLIERKVEETMQVMMECLQLWRIEEF